jgi:hypothetical protein
MKLVRWENEWDNQEQDMRDVSQACSVAMEQMTLIHRYITNMAVQEAHEQVQMEIVLHRELTRV